MAKPLTQTSAKVTMGHSWIRLTVKFTDGLEVTFYSSYSSYRANAKGPSAVMQDPAVGLALRKLAPLLDHERNKSFKNPGELFAHYKTMFEGHPNIVLAAKAI
jgi:hypothetical protein